MNATEVRPKRQVTLPAEVCDPAGIDVGDRLEWRFEHGEIVGRKLVAVAAREPFPRGSLASHFTPEHNAAEMELLKGCVLGPA